MDRQHMELFKLPVLRCCQLRHSPLDLLLGQAVVLHQSVVALLQIPGCCVQLLVHFSVLVVHLTQQVHLLGQVLMGEKKSLFLFFL